MGKQNLNMTNTERLCWDGPSTNCHPEKAEEKNRHIYIYIYAWQCPSNQLRVWNDKPLPYTLKFPNPVEIFLAVIVQA